MLDFVSTSKYKEESGVVKELESSDYVMEKQGSGEVKIAADVVAVIAALAATEVEGVSSMAGNITNELISRFGM